MAYKHSKKLTEKQKKFADRYIVTLNGAQSYREAYPNVKSSNAAEVGASNLIRNPKVKKYIDERLEELKSERVADQQEVLEFLTSVMRGEVTEPLLVLNGDGYQRIVDSKPNVSTRKAAAVDLGKRYGLFVDKQEITQKTIEISVGDWDAEDET